MRSFCVILIGCLLLSLPTGVSDGQETKELVTDADQRSLRTNMPQYIKALGATSLTQTDAALIREFMRVQVLQMTLKENERNLSKIRTSLKREIDLRAKQPAKEVMLPEIVKHCRTLLNYPLPIRLNAVMLVAELNETSAEIAKGTPAIPYAGMVDMLIEVINDKEQHEALKVPAVNGLHRLSRDSSPKVDVRLRIAQTLVQQLELTTTSSWYRMVCIQALARVDILYDSTRKPFVIQKLAEILVDSKQDWRVRADSAYALARVPMDANVNLPLILYEIARFAHDMSEQYNKTKNASHWRYCMIRLYLVFKPEDATDTALLDRTTRAPLTKFRTETQGVFQIVLPIINDVIEFMPQKAIATASIDKLKTWIDDHPPTNLTVSLDPNARLKPIRNAAG